MPLAHDVTCNIRLEGDIIKYIIAIIQSECTISTGGITMTKSDSLKYLGVHINSQLDFREQKSEKCKIVANTEVKCGII